MAIQLRPRNYKPNLSWQMLTKNKLDTFTCQPYVNDQLSPSVIHSEELTSVNVAGTTRSLPLADSVGVTHRGSAYNTDLGDNMAFGDVQAVMASGTFTLQLTTPLPTSPTVRLRFEGETKYVNRASKTYDTMENLFWGQSNFASIIRANANGTESWSDSKSADTYNRGSLSDATLVDYTQPSVPLFPFVKVVRAAGVDINSWQVNKPQEHEVLTHWIDGITGSTMYCASTDNWSGRNNTDAWLSWDTKAFETPGILFNSQRAAFVNKTLPITTEVIKVNDYEYTINWSAPVRYAYAAASQMYALSSGGTRTFVDVDGYAFLDCASKIIVEVVAQEMNTDTVDVSYSWRNNELTTDIINNYPLSFGANEFITSQAYFGAMFNFWTRQAATWILSAYKNGKYIVECDVYAQWAVANNIHVNSEIQVMLQDGTYITRGADVATFAVKTVEKTFKGNEFIYSLRLLEV